MPTRASRLVKAGISQRQPSSPASRFRSSPASCKRRRLSSSFASVVGFDPGLFTAEPGWNNELVGVAGTEVIPFSDHHAVKTILTAEEAA